MLTRIRIEAEAPTPDAAQRDIFAAYDALIAVVWPRDVVPQCDVTDEVYAQVRGTSDYPRLYRGRAVMRFRDTVPVDADRMMPRVEWLASLDARYSADAVTADHVVAAAREGEMPGALRAQGEPAP